MNKNYKKSSSTNSSNNRSFSSGSTAGKNKKPFGADKPYRSGSKSDFGEARPFKKSGSGDRYESKFNSSGKPAGSGLSKRTSSVNRSRLSFKNTDTDERKRRNGSDGHSEYPRRYNDSRPKQNFKNRRPQIDGSYIGGDLVVGKRAVYELLATKHRAVSEVLVAASERDASVKEIIKFAESCGVRWNPVSQYYLDDICEMNSRQSIVAKCQPLQVYPMEELVSIASQKIGSETKVPLLVMLDEIVDVQNIGAILRNASCFGAVGVILPVHRSVKITPAVTKVAAGAIEYLRFALVGGIPSAIQSLKTMDVLSVGLDGSAKVSIKDFKVDNKPTCLIVGSEEKGISQLAKKRCDSLVKIPQLNSPNSLNAASATAVGLYEISNKLLSAKVY